MKERNFYSDEFEDLIREKTDQYKMYPSDKVWKGIYNSLHTKRRRYIIGMSLLVGGILFFAGKELLGPSHINAGTIASSAGTPSAKDITPSVSPEAFSSFQKENEPVAALSSVNGVAIQPVSSDKLAISELVTDPLLQMSISENLVAGTDANIINQTSAAEPEMTALHTELSSPVASAVQKNNSNAAAIALGIHQGVELSPVLTTDPQQVEMMNAIKEENKQQQWLKQNASFELTSISKRNKWKWEAYITPTFNYRNLTTNGNYTPKTNIQTGPVSINHSGDPNAYVDQKPGVGIQLGGAIVYRLTRNLSLKMGLQFDYSRYYIHAYSTSTEPAIITLNSFNGSSFDNITSYTNLRNFGGTSPKLVQNRYYQLSVPVGLEMRVIGNGKLQLHVAGSLQPTYLLNRDIYMLTNDYTNYTKEPSLIRRWNLNGGVEAFLSYDMGSFKVQVGPQFRYQFFSTYSNQYALKENLMEYGIKIGITKTIR